jgi:hypothetical protein
VVRDGFLVIPPSERLFERVRRLRVNARHLIRRQLMPEPRPLPFGILP